MRYFLTAFVLFFNFSSYSQSSKINFDSSNFFEKLKKKTIEFKIHTAEINEEFKFSDIKIIDKRYDTTAIGYIKTGDQKIENIKLVTGNSIGKDLEVFLNNIYQKKVNANNASLVIIMRKFWLYKNYNYRSDPNYNNSKRVSYSFNLNFDFFVYSDNVFKALIRKDTIIKIYKNPINKEEGIIIGQSIQDILNSLPELKNSSLALTKRGYTINEINENYNKSFKKAILSDKNLNRGVYMSFNEFKSNSPSYTSFEVKKTTLADDIYLIDGKDTIPTQKAWGYCDGKKSYIKMGGNLFELNKQDNSFSFIGNKGLTHNYSNPRYNYNDNYSPGVNLGAAGLSQLLFSTNKFKIHLFPMKLDMETGEVY